MANAIVPENFLLDFSSPDDLNDMEFSNVVDSLLMSLLEDSRLEQGDDERLRFLMESLQAEVSDDDSFTLTSNSEGQVVEDYRFSSNLEQMDSCCTSPDHLDYEWMDMAYPSHIDDMTAYFAGCFAENLENVAELGAGDYSQVCFEMQMEEDIDYSSLWQ